MEIVCVWATLAGFALPHANFGTRLRMSIRKKGGAEDGKERSKANLSLRPRGMDFSEDLVEMGREGVTSDITGQNCPNTLLDPLCSFSLFLECRDGVYLFPQPIPLCWSFLCPRLPFVRQRCREPPVYPCSSLNHPHLSLVLLANRDIKPTSRPLAVHSERGSHGLA